ncbi:aminopeptidase P family protein [Pelagibacterales bacterium SAG-MED17]|nr:aminopeptidase P family protein [Pelagibacterales bacterium SAG-MED17]
MSVEINNIILSNNLDGYILPKNDNYFTEYSKINNLKSITNFSGSAGFAIFLKNKKYLFVDGRYTIQAEKEVGKKFEICEIPYVWPKDILKKEIKIGFDPDLFTLETLNKYFGDSYNLVPLNYKFKRKNNTKNNYPFFSLETIVAGESVSNKISRLIEIMKKKKIDYNFISAGENVCWLLNLRGKDLPNSPIANCKIILTKDRKIYFFSSQKKIKKIKISHEKFKINFLKEDSIFKCLIGLKHGNFCIDSKTCSVFEESLIGYKFKIVDKEDPIYNLKSLKNKTEIQNMVKAHIEDGVALTKFLYWIKNHKINSLTEKKIESKLESFRKNGKNYLYPSFDTIAGSGPNGAVIHYRSDKFSNRKLNKNDLLLLDSGGQYKWGTTDVTRTVCFSNVSNKIKDIFTRVLKGHIGVALSNIKQEKNGHNIDKIARKSLNSVGLDYRHGTGHGVGAFLNVHEGPQGISKNNFIKLKEGMILSNEPGFYKKNNFGIRVENLVFIKKIKSKLLFENLTMAPIDTDLINFKMLNKKEKNYLFKYHFEVYNNISQFLNKNEKKWLAKLI